MAATALNKLRLAATVKSVCQLTPAERPVRQGRDKTDQRCSKRLDTNENLSYVAGMAAHTR